MGSVRMEIMPGLTRFFADEHSGQLVLEREVRDGITVRELLEDVTSENPEFRKELFDSGTGNLSDHLCLVLNGKFLELSGGLEARLKPGDTVRLMLGFSGG